MKSSRPAGPRRSPPPHHKEPPTDEAAERALFLQSLARLDEAPDKDAQSELSAPRRIPRGRLARRSRARPQATLDLHGMKAEDARHALARFVATSRRRGDRLVLVITGKGLRSEGGVAVLKQEVERWIRRHGKGPLEAWSEAPRRLGGRGAYLLHLRR